MLAKDYPDAQELFAAAAAAEAAEAADEAAVVVACGEAGEVGDAPADNALGWLAAQTEGFSGSDLVQLCSQAAAVPIQEKISAE